MIIRHQPQDFYSYLIQDISQRDGHFETIEKINQLIEKHNMKIVDTDEKMFLKKKHKSILLHKRYDKKDEGSPFVLFFCP